MLARRVLIVAPHFPPETVAGATRLASLARELAASGRDVLVVAPRSGEAPATGVRVAGAQAPDRAPGPLGQATWQLRLGSALARTLASEIDGGRFAPDVALVSTPPPLAALLAVRAIRARQIPVVLDARDLWPDVLIEARALRARGLPARVLRRIEQGLLARVDAVVTVTAAKAARLRERFAGRMDIAPNGVDAAWAGLAAEYAGGGDAPLVALSAGNVGLAQDVGVLARALAPPHAPAGVEGVVIGAGEDLPRAQHLAARLGSALRFEPPIGRAEVRQRLAACGVSVVTLRDAAMADSVPSKLLEAMALGVPVILVASGEAAAIVRESEGGFVVPPGDARALSEALGRARALGVEGRRAMGARARAFVMARFRREQSALIVADVLEGVLAPDDLRRER